MLTPISKDDGASVSQEEAEMVGDNFTIFPSTAQEAVLPLRPRLVRPPAARCSLIRNLESHRSGMKALYQTAL